MKKARKLIPIIILNWNGEIDTIDCLKSIRESASSGFLPVIVDNGSNQKSLETLKDQSNRIYKNILFFKKEELVNFNSKEFSKFSNLFDNDTLIFIENGENLGFAKGNNIGVHIAELIDSEWVMLLNNDTEIEQDSLNKLFEFINANPSFKAVTPQIRLYNPKTKIWNCGGELTHFGSRKYYFADEDYIDAPQFGSREITFITGCALLYKFKETGVLTEKFFFGEEDYEFSLRMKKNKMKMACVFDSIIYHKVGASIKKNSNTLGLIYIHYANRLINTRDYYSTFRWKASKILSYLYIPLLLMKSKINPMKTLPFIIKMNLFIKENYEVNKKDFLALKKIKL